MSAGRQANKYFFFAQAPEMAATFLLALFLNLVYNHYNAVCFSKLPPFINSRDSYNHSKVLGAISNRFKTGVDTFTPVAYGFRNRVTWNTTLTGKVRRPIVVWTTRGLTFLSAPERFVLIDITVSKDIESNPGPSEETSNHDNILLPVTSGPEQQKQSQGVIAREKNSSPFAVIGGNHRNQS